LKIVSGFSQTNVINSLKRLAWFKSIKNHHVQTFIRAQLSYLFFERCFVAETNCFAQIKSFWKCERITIKNNCQHSRFAASFRGISRLGSAFFTLRWFNVARIMHSSN